MALAYIAERQHANHRGDELIAVAEEEDEDVEHQEEERGDPEHILSDPESPGRDELRDGDGGGREPLDHPLDIDAEGAR